MMSDAKKRDTKKCDACGSLYLGTGFRGQAEDLRAALALLGPEPGEGPEATVRRVLGEIARLEGDQEGWRDLVADHARLRTDADRLAKELATLREASNEDV